MSLPTVAAARIFKGQQVRQGDQESLMMAFIYQSQAKKEAESKTGLADFDGNSVKLSWENFPNVGLSLVRVTQDDLSRDRTLLSL